MYAGRRRRPAGTLASPATLPDTIIDGKYIKEPTPEMLDAALEKAIALTK